jgi:hypothetical protein
MKKSIWIGWEPREAAAFAVARHSAKRRLTQPIPISGLVLSDLQQKGLYTRPMEWRDGPTGNKIMWDVISDAPMATEFACSRFLTKVLAKTGWALFADCDVLFRVNLARLFDELDPQYAVYCVHHDFRPAETVKMDGQPQVQYEKKLWSSVAIFNCDHPANSNLTVDLVNSIPGRDLHRFSWLHDSEIGELGHEWNWIPGHSELDVDPKCVHFSLGAPDLPGYEDVAFAQEWRDELNAWAK